MVILILGGSGSGKSEFAEKLVEKLEKKPRLYIATMYPFDEECHQRIARHREMRKLRNFDTLECYTGLSKVVLGNYQTVLLECISNLAANELYQENGAKEACVEEILNGVQKVKEQCEHLLIVSNEIFSDGMKYDAESRRYQAYLGTINQRLAQLADVVVEVVYSIPIVQKGRLEGNLL